MYLYVLCDYYVTFLHVTKNFVVFIQVMQMRCQEDGIPRLVINVDHRDRHQLPRFVINADYRIVGIISLCVS
jgi:hypothetical protein